MTPPFKAPVYMVIADDQCDQVVETLAIAKREARDLKRMGCAVRVKKFASWYEAEKYQDAMEGN